MIDRIPAGLEDVCRLDKLLVGSRLVTIRLGTHGGISRQVDGVLTLDRLRHEVINGDGTTGVRVEGELDVVSDRASGGERVSE